MKKDRLEVLLEATNGIREEYIEEAAAEKPAQRRWIGFVAAAAVLVLLVSLVGWLPGRNATGDYLPVFAIRAYALDGMVNTLSNAGESSTLSMGESDLFPGKQTYTLDVSLTHADGSRLELENSTFEFPRYNRELLQPGHSDEKVSITLVDEEDFYGYRIVGWCDDHDTLDITIRDKKGMILHQKSMLVEFSEGYSVKVYTSYTYEEGLSTEQLIAKLFDTGQDYFIHTSIASSWNVEYNCLVSNCGGFAELEQRKDAASLLLQRWFAEMEQSEIRFGSIQGSGRIGLVLSQTPHWRNLTEKELAQIADYGIPRGCPEPEENMYFPGHRIFSYELMMEQDAPRNCVLEISYNGQSIQTGEQLVEDEHFKIYDVIGGQLGEESVQGWHIIGWFDRLTVITVSVYDGDVLLRREVLLIIPSKDRYDEYQIKKIF